MHRNNVGQNDLLKDIRESKSIAAQYKSWELASMKIGEFNSTSSTYNASSNRGMPSGASQKKAH
jgi:hypothetical protein